jgi:hypothetical protein
LFQTIEFKKEFSETKKEFHTIKYTENQISKIQERILIGVIADSRLEV